MQCTGGFAAHRRAKRHERGGGGRRSVKFLQVRRMGHPGGAGRAVSESVNEMRRGVWAGN